jgi:hypothetical protein
MSVLITPVPASPFAEESSTRLDITGLDSTTEVYLDFEAPTSEGDEWQSYPFVGSSDGKHTYLGVVFPEAGSWVVTAKQVSDDSTVAAAATIVVQARA